MKLKNIPVLFEEEQDGGFSVSVPSLPGCFSQGNTYEEALKNIREAISLYLEDEKCLHKNTREFLVPVEVSC
jgi:predicted RNase H-like HicB family nuclease